MEEYQRHFIDFAIKQGVLKFGEFTLKSGRISPYFFNVGMFNTGEALSRLGQFYAAALYNSHIDYDLLLGPAYKGIPLAVATTIALSEHYQLSVPYAFNRKEAKDHGEGGSIVGHPLQGNIMLVDDVITAGTAIRESIHLIQENNATLAGVLVAIDRQEKGQTSELSAIQEIEKETGAQVITIVTLSDIINYLKTHPEFSQYRKQMKAYQEKYGVAL